VTSRYSGEFTVTGNKLTDNFGGVAVYADTNRFPDNLNDDSSCSNTLGPLDQPNSSTYYTQTKVLQTGGDTAVSGSSVTSAGGTQTLCSNYGAPGAQGNAQQTVTAPSAGMAVFDERTGKFLGNVAHVTSAKSFTLSRSPGSAYGRGDALLLSAYGGCGPADYFNGGRGVASGRPAADYWSNCIWGSQNVTVKDNAFSVDAATVTGCTTTANLCGYQQLVAFNGGVPALMQYWFSYTNYIAKASGGLGNVFSDNAYTWSGGGPGGWQFRGGNVGTDLTQSTWTSADGQDAGSSFGS
jgi:hypothetical protein